VAADGSFSTVLPEGQYQIEVSVGLPYVVRAVSDGSSDLPGGTLQFSQRNGGGPPVRLPTQPDGPLLKIVNGDTKNLLVTLTIPTFAIRGRLRTFETSGARMVLTGSRLTEPLVAAVGPDGAFEFPKVPAGGYSLGSTAPGVGRRLVVSDRDVLDTEFVELTGRMIASGGEPPPNLAFSFAGNAELLVSPFTNAEPCPGGCGRGGTSQLTGRIAAVQVIPEIRAADGSFRIVAPEGEYRVTVTGFQSSHSLKSFRFGDVDLLTNPLRVSLNGSRELRLEFGAK
jgi:hypothetical protein